MNESDAALQRGQRLRMPNDTLPDPWSAAWTHFVHIDMQIHSFCRLGSHVTMLSSSFTEFTCIWLQSSSASPPLLR
ncbi:hypothetical protein [Herbaspirillum rubrisubalbicans]|uniref:hypothetical protein n=1 Tax=Herbaspirillum rubrisubalbicans TaxID=80842 RepID=UPI0013DD97BF|nr:hypothetical protein [Herbaspirillum rubrisubalbicans]